MNCMVGLMLRGLCFLTITVVAATCLFGTDCSDICHLSLKEVESSLIEPEKRVSLRRIFGLRAEMDRIAVIIHRHEADISFLKGVDIL